MLAKKYIASLFALLLFSGAMAQNSSPSLSFRAWFDKDTILVGDQVMLNISATVPNGVSVAFPKLGDTLVIGVETVDVPIFDSVAIDAATSELLYRIKVTSFDSGYYFIPGLPLTVQGNGFNDTVQTTALYLDVHSIPRDTLVAGIYDIKAPISQPITFKEALPWIVGVLIFLGLAALIVFMAMRKKRNLPILPKLQPEEPAHVIALRELKQIREQKLFATTEHKLYHTRLTDVVRQYLERRYGVNAMEQTTSETMVALSATDLKSNKELEKKLSQTLTLADLVKFAKYIPSVTENEASLTLSEEFVEQTAPVANMPQNTGIESIAATDEDETQTLKEKE